MIPRRVEDSSICGVCRLEGGGPVGKGGWLTSREPLADPWSPLAATSEGAPCCPACGGLASTGSDEGAFIGGGGGGFAPTN